MNTTHPAAPLAHPVSVACQRLGVGRVKLYELLGRGEIKGFKVGNKRLIPESELQAFIAARMAEESAKAASA